MGKVAQLFTIVEPGPEAESAPPSMLRRRARPDEPVEGGELLRWARPVVRHLGVAEAEIDERTRAYREEIQRWVDLLMTVENHGLPDVLEIHLLRPDAWIREHGALEGHVVGVTLDDLNVAGPALVTGLGTAGHIASGTRCPATGWVRHTSHDVIALALDGAETLKLTRHHRLLSADRKDWVHAGDLEAGEALQTKNGVVRVASVGAESLPPVEVFNLEVFSAHQYFVGQHRVVAHNSYVQQLVADLISQLPQDLFKLGECTNCASAIVEALEGQGLSGQILNVKANGGAQLIASDLFSAGTPISTNGFRQAIQVGEIVFDNLNPGGVARSIWEAALQAPRGVTITAVPF